MWRRGTDKQESRDTLGGSGRMWRARPRSAAAVVAEATAIIEGTVADVAADTWSPPPWTWINRLAHGSWEDISSLAQGRWRAMRVWEGATTFLAGEIRTCARTPEGLLRVQRSALIPLELDVLDGQVAAPNTPLELVSMVRGELDRIRRADDHWCEGPC